MGVKRSHEKSRIAWSKEVNKSQHKSTEVTNASKKQLLLKRVKESKSGHGGTGRVQGC